MMRRLQLLGANRGATTLTNIWSHQGRRPLHTTIVDSHPGRAEQLAQRWRTELSTPSAGVEGRAECHVTQADLYQWAIDDPVALAQGLPQGHIGAKSQWVLNLTTRIPLAGYSHPVIGLGGTVTPGQNSTRRDTQNLLKTLANLSKRGSNREVTAETLNDLLLEKVRYLSWYHIMNQPGGLFVVRGDVPTHSPCYPLALQPLAGLSRRQMLREASTYAPSTRLTHAFCCWEERRLFLIFLVRQSTKSRWRTAGSLELPPPTLRNLRESITVTD